LHVDDIKRVIADRVVQKREHPQKMPCALKEVNNLRRVSVKNRQRLSKYLSKMENRRSRISSTGDLVTKVTSPLTSSPRPLTEVDFSRSESDASFRRNILARQALVRRGKGTRTHSRIPGLVSPREVDETDSPSVEYRRRAGRLRGGKVEEGDLDEHFEDALCNSIDEDEDDQFYSTVQS